MKADVQYNDFIGTTAADVSDFIGMKYSNGLAGFAEYFKVDQSRFEVVGVSIYGTDDFYLSLICVDKKKSTSEKEHIVNMSIEVENSKDILDLLFKRLHIVLHSRFDKKYCRLEYDEEVDYEDFHESEID